VVGVVAGLGAVVFRALIGLLHNLLFLGKFSAVYDANVHTPPSPWGPFVIFVPVVGAVGVAFLVKNFAPEAKGHGVPEVMDPEAGSCCDRCRAERSWHMPLYRQPRCLNSFCASCRWRSTLGNVLDAYSLMAGSEPCFASLSKALTSFSCSVN